MKKLVSSKTVALTFGVLVICFAVGFYVVAWQEPTEDPPEGNVPAPINVGSDVQTKEGPLVVNSEGFLTGLVVQNGELCLGADCRDSWPLSTENRIVYKMTATSFKSGETWYAKTVNYTCQEGATGNEVVDYSPCSPIGGVSDFCGYSQSGPAISFTAFVRKVRSVVNESDYFAVSECTECAPWQYGTECALGNITVSCHTIGGEIHFLCNKLIDVTP